jgi:peptide/nickel transport system permease protein
MGKYILKRVGMAAIVVVLSMTFVSTLVHIIPGDPVAIILGPRASPEMSAIVRKEMDLNSSVPAQVWHFVEHAVQGNLGHDFVSQLPVTTLIASALPHTMILAVASLGLAVLIGIPLGVYASTHANSPLDRLTGLISVALITLPPYVAGLLLLLLFSVYLRWLPAIGVGSFSDPLDYVKHLILPTSALALSWIGYFARLIRASMLEVLNTSHIRTARAFGVRDRIIFYKYALKNAIIPTVAVMGVGLGTLMGGAIFVEVIFTRPGLGSLIFQSIETRNYPVVRGGILVIAVLFVGMNLLADLSYRFLDPRIRVQTGN